MFTGKSDRNCGSVSPSPGCKSACTEDGPPNPCATVAPDRQTRTDARASVFLIMCDLTDWCKDSGARCRVDRWRRRVWLERIADDRTKLQGELPVRCKIIRRDNVLFDARI